MYYFSKDDILYLHSKIVAIYGGTLGLKDEGMLDSALNCPLMSFDRIDLYKTAIDKIARLSFSLVMDHPFYDGNKRIGAKILDIGLKANGIDLKASNEELIEEFLLLASSKFTYQEFLSWVLAHI